MLKTKHTVQFKITTYLWLAVGLLLSVSATLFVMSKSINVGQFYDVGDVYEVADSKLVKDYDNFWYDEELGSHIVVADLAQIKIGGITGSKKWKYIYVDLENMTSEGMFWTITYWTKTGAIGTQQWTVVPGINNIPIVVSNKYKRITIDITGQNQQRVTLQQMQFRETPYVPFSKKKFLAGTVICFLLYILGTSVRSRMVCRWKNNKNATGSAAEQSLPYMDTSEKQQPFPIRLVDECLDVIQYVYGLVFGLFSRIRIEQLSEKCVGYLRTGMFFLWLIYAAWVNNKNLYLDEGYYKYFILISSIVMLSIALLMREKSYNIRYRWTGNIPRVWLVLWTMTMISDLFVGKFFKFHGYVMMFVVGLFFWLWGQMREPQRILKELKRALEVFFVCATVFCMFCRRSRIGVSYKGFYRSPNDMAMFALLMLVVFLTELDVLFCCKIINRKWMILLSSWSVGVTLCVYYLWRTEILTCQLTGVAVGVMFLYRLLRKYPWKKYGWETLIKSAMIALLCSVVVIIPVNQAIRYLPKTLGTQINYKNETTITLLDEEEIAQMKVLHPGELRGATRKWKLIQKPDIWEKHIKWMNLAGNGSVQKVSGDSVLESNVYLAYAYRYGMFVLIPLLLLYALYARKIPWKKDFFLPGSFVAFMGVALTQNVEQPFLLPLWFVFYLGIGSCFQGKVV